MAVRGDRPRAAPEPAGLGPGSASRLGTGFPPVPRPPLSAAFLPATLTGDGILGSGFFSHPRTPPRHLDLSLLAGIIFYFSIILFVLSPGQRWRCSPGGPKGGCGGSRGGGAAPPPPPRSVPGALRLPRHFHGATAPTSGRWQPSEGAGGSPRPAPARGALASRPQLAPPRSPSCPPPEKIAR